jgi:hypothetical protein
MCVERKNRLPDGAARGAAYVSERERRDGTLSDIPPWCPDDRGLQVGHPSGWGLTGLYAAYISPAGWVPIPRSGAKCCFPLNTPVALKFDVPTRTLEAQ